MSAQSYKGISNRGRSLLAQQENDQVDFKESLAGLSADDLVAFANTETGGALLIGVRETEDENGLQGTEIKGCEVGDSVKMTVLNKAGSCLPPLEGVQVIFENVAETPFLRIEIPSSPALPHCTGGGIYKIREDGRNRAIHPRTLLSLFVEREGERFLGRFREVTRDLEAEIRSLREDLADARRQLELADSDS